MAGLFTATTGLGEGARLMLAALELAGVNPLAVDLSAWFDQSDVPGPFVGPPGLGFGERGTLLVHVSAPYLPFALWALGRKRVRGRRIIGYWAWELPQLPKSWRVGLRSVHEVWVPSRFTQDAITRATTLPVRVVPHPLLPLAPPAATSRQKLGISPEAFVVVSAFHLGSSFARKNPLAAIRAFQGAFGTASDKVLVLKLIDPGTAPWALRTLHKAVGEAPNIKIIDQLLPRHELMSLIAASDVVLSLHRAEGFGLVLAEAMQLGKPVVATGWSGNLDFMTRRNSALISCRLVPAKDPQGTYDHVDQRWAEPDVEEAAVWLRRLAENPALRTAIGRQASTDIKNQLALDVVSRSIADLLGAPAPDLLSD